MVALLVRLTQMQIHFTEMISIDGFDHVNVLLIL